MVPRSLSVVARGKTEISILRLLDYRREPANGSREVNFLIRSPAYFTLFAYDLEDRVLTENANRLINLRSIRRRQARHARRSWFPVLEWFYVICKGSSDCRQISGHFLFCITHRHDALGSGAGSGRPEHSQPFDHFVILCQLDLNVPRPGRIDQWCPARGKGFEMERTWFVRRWMNVSLPAMPSVRRKRRRKTTKNDDVFNSQKNFLADIEVDYHCAEHILTLEQLSDLHPLTRINQECAPKSRGLNTDEALARMENGANLVSSYRKQGRFFQFFLEFMNTFRVLMIAAALLCLLIFALDRSHLAELYMGVVLLAMLALLCWYSYVQHKQGLKKTSGFQSMLPTNATVLRDNQETRICASDLVVGDLVWVRPGNRVPADIRLIHAESLRVETSWLTGEMDPIEYNDEQAPRDQSPLTAHNIVFSGCCCTSGEGLGVVVKIGNDTLFGKVVQMTNREKGRKSRLEKEHRHFVLVVTIFALVVGVLSFLIGFAANNHPTFLSIFVNGFLVVLVVSVPQGLPVTLTAQLAIVARRLGKRNIFMKKLDIAETFGTTSVLMCDKTGVFTTNNRIVKALVDCNDEPHLADDFWKDDKEKTGVLPDHLDTLLTVMSVCNKAHIEPSARQSFRKLHHSWRKGTNIKTADLPLATNGSGAKPAKPLTQHTLQHLDLKEKSVIGRPMDVAFLKFANRIVSVEHIRRDYEIAYEIPFSGQNRYHLIIAYDKTEAMLEDEIVNFHLFIKGAPEEIITRCSQLLNVDGIVDIDDNALVDFEEAYMSYANEGNTCIAFAMVEFEAPLCTRFSSANSFPSKDWCFLGMAAMYDPPREDISNTVAKAIHAGIKVFMVTGDHPSSAEALCRQMGIPGICSALSEDGKLKNTESVEKDSGICEVSSTESKDELTIIHGNALEALKSEQWDQLLQKQHIIFARTKPTHKVMIIEECQARNLVVAATGDSVLDAPALKKADIGLAMDEIGAIFAKEAADIVLMQNDLSNIVSGIEEGRLLFENIKKTIAYVLAHIIPELCPVLMTSILGFPLGLNSLQVITIDLLTEIPPSLALIYEKAEEDLMRRAPRKKNCNLVPPGLFLYSYLFAGCLISAGCVLAFFSVFWYYGIATSDLLLSSHHHWVQNSQNLTTSRGLVFDSDSQLNIHRQASAAWHITLVISQVFHLWMCTTRRVSLFRNGFKNVVAVVAIIFEVLMLLFLVYTPGVQMWIGVSQPPTFVWAFPLVVGFVLLVFNEVRKFLIRRNTPSLLVRYIKW
uniref:Cation_ATPase_N domain-containing protein n=1 Tax=Steinernema glaseri TaxID=37863 RepID=A0A1I7ZE95_9BILA